MNLVLLLPAIVSILLLGAHFYRAGYFILVALTIFLPFILLIRKSWPARIIQTFLIIGSIEWIRTLVLLSTMRQSTGAPWIRLVFILGGVALFTLGSAFTFKSKSLRKRYCLTSD
jgi:hypothetical protein